MHRIANETRTFEKLATAFSQIETDGEFMSDAPAREIEDFRNALAAFAGLPDRTRRKTILEISKFPHSELACSNILEFFLNPMEEHGFGDLFLKTMLEAVGSQFASEELGSPKVTREDRTDSNRSLDIVVNGGSFLIGIENKLRAPLNNPLDEYDRWLKQKAKNEQIDESRVERILLCLREDEPPKTFKPLTYDNWFRVLLSKTAGTLLTVDLVYLTYLTDFLNTMQNLKTGTRMDERTMKFFRENRSTTAKLYQRMQELGNTLKEKTERLKGMDGLPKGTKIRLLSRGPDDPNYPYFYSTAICEQMVNKDLQIHLEATVRLIERAEKSWQIYAWGDKGQQQLVRQWMRQKKLKHLRLREEDGSWIFKEFDFTQDAEAEKAYRELIEAFAGS